MFKHSLWVLMVLDLIVGVVISDYSWRVVCQDKTVVKHFLLFLVAPTKNHLWRTQPTKINESWQNTFNSTPLHKNQENKWMSILFSRAVSSFLSTWRMKIRTCWDFFEYISYFPSFKWSIVYAVLNKCSVCYWCWHQSKLKYLVATGQRK